MQRQWLLTVVVVPAFMFLACGSESTAAEDDEDKKADEAEESDEADEADEADESDEKDAPTGEVVLEEMDEPYLGKMLMPKGAEATSVSDKGGHYKFALSPDGFDALYIDYETIGGAKTLDKAKGASKWTAPGNADLVGAATNDAGVHVVELKRDSDNKIFVLGFRPDNYIKCWGPAEQLENCKKIIDSISMPD